MNRLALEEMSWAMAEVYAAVTDRILINLAKYFPYVHNSGEMRGSFEYQARMLAQMGNVTRESVEIIAGSLGNADAALRTSLTNAIIEALKTEEPKLRRAAEQGLLGGTMGQITPNQMQAFNLYYKQSADKLNLVNTVMLESTQAAYSATVADAAARIQQIQGALNTGAGEVITGVSTWNKAMHDAVQKMVKSGITGFIDHGGHHWSPEAYAAMDIRTTLFNTSRAAVWERNDDYGNDLYQVSSHNGARPLCYPWQGKVISRDDLSRDVEDLDGNTVHVYAQSETTYGEAAGLFGVNCGHYPMVFIPGVSTLREVPQDEEENAKTYAESQQQRALERKLREEKRDLEVLKAQGASEEEIKAQRDKVRKASGDIDRFCDETGRTRDRSREYTPINATWPDQDDYTPPTTPAPQISQPLQSSESVVQLATETTNGEVESILGISREEPIPVGKARTWTNPDYQSGKWGYTHNCQRCVQAYELRRRGYDVEAMPRPARSNTIVWGSEIFNGYGKSKSTALSAYRMSMTAQAVKDAIANGPDGARYSVYVEWKRKKSAHVFIAEKLNGIVVYLDPQSNKREVGSYFERGKAGQFGLFRMDDKPITTNEKLLAATVRGARK